MSARVEPRFTEGVDLVTSVDGDGAADRVSAHLMRRGYRLIKLLLRDDAHRVATLRLQPPVPEGVDVVAAELPILDCIFATCGIEPEIVAEATETEVLTGVRVKTASIAHLVVMKLLSECPERDKDRRDLRHLLKLARPHDLRDVERLIRLVKTRGFSRGKDLRAVLQRFVGESSGNALEEPTG